MSHRLITVSYTALNAGGGVPAFNRALHSAFPDRQVLHFCWRDFPWHDSVGERVTEWDRARLLNEYLVKSRMVTSDDVVVGDGFWCDGLDHLPMAVSHCHGIWSHLTHDDVLQGKAPDMPGHHKAQVAFRRRWLDRGRHMTAVSKFIAREMFLQWGFEVERVIDNGVDTRVYRPALQRVDRPRPIVIHGVNDVTNENKGWRHIKELEEYLDADVMSLDHAYSRMSSTGLSKPEVLAQADLIVHSSGFEGNSMFIAESLACGVPIVAYNVGYLSEFFGDRAVNIGVIMDRRSRSPKLTLDSCREVLSSSPGVRMQMGLVAQELAPSLDRFVSQWRSYVEEVENA